ncbi:MAG: HIT family protein [Acidobacteriota bacterium]
MEGCAFCRIVEGRSEAHIVHEDSVCLAFLDQRPLFPGHCLLVPKTHCETLADLPVGLLGPLLAAAQLLARALEEGLWAEGSFVAINNRVSQSVPHLHVHVVPRRRKDGLKGFFWPRQGYRDSAHQESVAETLRQTLARLRKGGEAEGDHPPL